MALTSKNHHKKKLTASRKKRHGLHHKKGDSYSKAYWPYLPIMAIVTVGLLLSGGWSNARKDVLGYATDISASSLLSGTNSQRVANGLGSLALNSLLSQAAQNKAADMAAKDYWSHTSPDGSTPWTFINAVGYSYQSAGENLAYGFATSSETITGWMNSPSHRENVLGSNYTEVGFGIVNTPNYQASGPQTIVVAMYGQPVTAISPVPTVQQTPAPAPTATTATTESSGSQASSSAGGSSNQAQTEATTASEGSPTTQTEESKAVTTALPDKSIKVAPSKNVSRLQTISANNASWTQFGVSMLASLAVLIFLLRHSFAWRKLLIKGEKFVLKHPIIDIAVVIIAVAGFVLTRTAGLIR